MICGRGGAQSLVPRKRDEASERSSVDSYGLTGQLDGKGKICNIQTKYIIKFNLIIPNILNSTLKSRHLA